MLAGKGCFVRAGQSTLKKDARRRRCYGFFGRNGAGKTTTITCMLNLIRPASGHAKLFGSRSIRG